MATKHDPLPRPETDLARTDEPAPVEPGFDFIDLLFGFPLAAVLAHIFFAGGVLTPVALPAVVPVLLAFVAQKSLRNNPQRFWRAIDYALAIFPQADDAKPHGLLGGSAVWLLESTRQAVVERAGYEDAAIEEGVYIETGVLPGSTEIAAPAVTATAVTSTTKTKASRSTAPDGTVEMLTLARLARCSTILLVGSRGSGKSTLLNALLTSRREPVMVYDPHAAPSEWPMAAVVHNSEASIAKGLVGAYGRLRKRKDERREGIRLKDWPKFVLAADEWRAIINDVTLPKELKLTPIDVSSKLMREGRKFDICMVIGAHGTTNAQLGCEGDNAGFLDSFDWIIYLGAEGRKMYAKHAPDIWQHVPMGTNDQGGTFPLVAICISPTTGDVRYLDMQGFDKMIDTSRHSTAPSVPWSKPQANVHDGLLAGLLSGNTVTNEDGSLPPVSNDVTKSFERRTSDVTNVTNVTVTPEEVALIADQLARNVAPSDIAKRLKGYTPADYKTFKAKVDTVKQMLASEPSKDAATASDDDPDPDIGPFGSMLGKE